eukprot:XP_010646376.1 PREDICTED: uncharacterized protein LOC100248646 [Vitis vinifera]
MDPLLFKDARDGSIEALLKLLESDPLILERVATTTADTPLHVAVVLGHLDFAKELLKHKAIVDKEGNTLLDLAAARRNHQVIELLLNCNDGSAGVLEVNATNKIGLTALDIFLLCPCESGGCSETERLLRRTAGAAREWTSNPINHGTPSEVRNAKLVVAILIATATYQAVLSPPSGLQPLDPKSGRGVVAEDRFLRLFFVFLNSTMFRISLYMIVKLIGKSHMQLSLLQP